ncbi:hypothetical protein GN956_G21220 [Arapaima gigas]
MRSSDEGTRSEALLGGSGVFKLSAAVMGVIFRDGRQSRCSAHTRAGDGGHGGTRPVRGDNSRRPLSRTTATASL